MGMVRRGPNIVTAGDRTRHNVRKHNQRLDRENLTDVKFGPQSIVDHCESRWGHQSPSDYPVYGISLDEATDEWVLTGFSLVHTRTRTTTDRRGAQRTDVLGKWIVYYDERFTPSDGLEIGRFGTKSVVMNKISADSSTRVYSGAYFVFPEDNPRRLFEKVDTSELAEFRKMATKVYED